MRIGLGHDIHQLTENRKLFLGGLEVPSPKGEVAHSDGDVLLHAIIDALLGAAALGDIGSHFPPTSEQWKNISSRILLKKTAELIRQNGYKIGNIDTTIFLESPKLRPYIDKIRETIATDLNIPVDSISVKAKTNEKMDSIGQGKAIEASAIVLINKKTER